MVTLSGKSCSTTLPEAMRVLLPMRIGPSSLAPAPMSTLSPMDGGVALPGVFSGAAQGNLMINRTVVPDFRGFADHDAHPVVDEQLSADLRAGMNLDAGLFPAPLADPSGQVKPVMPV